MTEQNAVTKLQLIPNKATRNGHKKVSHTTETFEMITTEGKKEVYQFVKESDQK